MIQPFTAADVARISHLQPDGWQSIKTFFQFYTEAGFCLPLKIEDNNRVVAVGSLILHTETAWLAHIIVEPGIRRKGYGLAITEELIASAEKVGRNIQLLIATDMGMPLYERFGFRHSCDYKFYHEPAPGMVDIPSRVRSLEPADFPEILSLDRRASGEDRGALLSRYSDRGWVCMDSQRRRVCGYFLPDLGEGTIVAQDIEAGRDLMKLRLAKVGTAPVLPAGNHAANAFLRDVGIKFKSSAARLVRNGDDPFNQRMVFNRVGGHLG
jgi:GNAT superfamily N-acetyltransferase